MNISKLNLTGKKQLLLFSSHCAVSQEVQGQPLHWPASGGQGSHQAQVSEECRGRVPLPRHVQGEHCLALGYSPVLVAVLQHRSERLSVEKTRVR